MASRLLDRVRESTAAGEFYTALQLIKSFWNRKKTSAFSEAVTAALECSKLFAAAGQGEAACEAACLCVQAWTEGSICADDDKTRMLMEIAGNLPAGKPQYDLLSACVKWTQSTGDQGSCVEFHHLAAMSAWASVAYPEATSHFVHAKQPAKFADMMYDWSLKGYPSETDLYLTRGVLLLLARGSLKDANQFRDRFVSHITTLSPTPLMNFVRFLLLTLERDAAPLLQLLRQKYKPHLGRDPSFDSLLGQIAKVFYNVAPPPSLLDSMAGMLGMKK